MRKPYLPTLLYLRTSGVSYSSASYALTFHAPSVHRRAILDVGLYKPQSGSYGAELGESNDLYGKSVLKETRKRNEARLLAEQEKKRQEWLDGEQKEREKSVARRWCFCIHARSGR